MGGIFLGIDIGSTTVKVVVLDSNRRLLDWRYVRSRGRPRQALLEAVDELADVIGDATILGLGLSGSGGGPVADLIGGTHVNELVAQTRAIGAYHPEARTVIEIGGQDSKLLSVRWDSSSQQMLLEDFAMNALCAAGTGAFLDQQAERLGVAIDQEYARLALTSTNPARIAGRCTVFAKSDMIHLQQVGTPLPDILMGVCLAMARNFTTVIGKGKRFVPPILFQGGVAYNAAVTRAFETVLKVPPGSIIVPEYHCLMAAIGTAFVAMDDAERGQGRRFLGFSALNEALKHDTAHESMPPLSRLAHHLTTGRALPIAEAAPIDVSLGIDVGSVSTNVVLIDDDNRVVARQYLPTAGRPLEAVRDGLMRTGLEVGSRVRVRAVGVTGSGRYLTGDFVGADSVRNEITAQARAAVWIDPQVDTLIEIGGQDSKFVRINRGAVVDFTMNNACAAGTGSFLEEQADRLRINIRNDFSELAYASPCPSALGERCTVFMESDLVHHQQHGAKVADLTAGLAYSIAENYLNRVVNGRALGNHVLFQGGVAANESVVSAFAALTKKEIIVPPNHDVTGAIGAAMLARESMARRANASGNGNTPPSTHFRGFDLSQRHYESSVFECKACPNLCEVHKVTIEGESPFFYGARCDKFEEAGRAGDQSWAAIPDHFATRERLLLGDWVDPGARPSNEPRRRRVGLMRNLTYFDFFPFWRGFLRALDFDVVLSSPTNPAIVGKTIASAALESCFPVKLAFGHLLDLFEHDVDVVLAPSIMTRPDAVPGQPHNHSCPLVLSTPSLLIANLGNTPGAPPIVSRPLHLQNARAAKLELTALAKELGATSGADIDRAIQAGWASQKAFEGAVRKAGREALEAIVPGQPAAVIVGRPYNGGDLGANLDLPYKLRRMGVLPIPMDFLPLEQASLPDLHEDMYWRSGQDILRAANVIRGDDRLQAIYLTNFNCGPDAFLITFFHEQIGDKPFLELEVDEHTADAGMITRCEAFFDSLNIRQVA
ncbi:MAG: ATPase [Gemmatimonadetes bacterium]|nr:ATPase [Gemmatimonadota bacterium]